jgi:hypothetical protein
VGSRAWNYPPSIEEVPAILIASIVFLLFALLVSGRAWLQRATAPAPRPHAVLCIALPGLDIGADAWPAKPGAAGYVEVWYAAHDSADYQPLLHLFGAPALSANPAPRPPAHPPSEPQGIDA